nr:TonB-dependent receptor [Thermoanaerobaculia bacterium]
FGPWAKTELYLNLGYGFHSNDARGATIRIDSASGEPAERVDPLVRGRAADLGLRGEWLPGLATTLSAFYLELDSELLFVGDAGTTEASRPSRRQGVEFANFWRVSPRISIELDAALSRARFADPAPEGDFIPGAIEQVVSAAVNFRDISRFFGGLRLRYFGERPLVEDDSIRSESSTLLNGRLGLGLGAGWEIALEVFNLLDEEVSDIDYYYASRLAGEPPEGVEDYHFHPSEPRSFRLHIAKRF